MAWTNLTFPFGSLLTSTKMTQLYDNFDALATGDASAPKILFDAMDSPTSGTTHIVWRSNVDGTSITGPQSASYEEVSAGQRPVIWNNGTVTASIEHRSNIGGQTTRSRVLLNGAVQATWSTSSTSFTQRTLSIAVVEGDIISWQHASDDLTGAPICRNMRLYSDTNTIVTY